MMSDAENGKKRPAVIGLTGGIACGKTTATDALRARGMAVVDADEVSRELTRRGAPLERDMCAAFPQAVKDGCIDRAALRAIIAADADARKKLNGLTHSAIINEIKLRLQAAPRPVVLCAPLLFETSLSALCDAVVCITCPRAVRLERLMRRDGMTAELAEAMLDTQLDEELRASLSDCCVSSDRPLEEYVGAVTALFDSLLA